ncbi:MAG TPA: hypothetical protein VM264_12535 [Acidimicrobiales bacterium]|nr:hypothetical protein [Acidimicrobiales bacterium]
MAFDAEATARFVLPGPVVWTCPACQSEQSASVVVPGITSTLHWEPPQ